LQLKVTKHRYTSNKYASHQQHSLLRASSSETAQRKQQLQVCMLAPVKQHSANSTAQTAQRKQQAQTAQRKQHLKVCAV